ncbi:MAG TPA: hypothetical protein VMJ12_04125 [Candidatus Acidoferrales bacterium]|nr:hypothetical protein [Candidatus Acidoferrales bacterium]
MSSPTSFNRPTLKEGLDAWKQLLAAKGLGTELRWIFEENLCFEKSPAGESGLHLGFQTRFAPPPEDALDIAFDHFCESDRRIVFYRLGGNLGKSICVLLCDPWFENKGEAEGFQRRDEWRVSFHPGQTDEIEEITDLGRWLRRVKHGRAFHDLDFCMTLAAIDEIKTHGRVLLPYERFASTMLNRLRRFLGQPA